MTEREQFLEVWESEYPTTTRVLKAFPGDQLHMKPHERSRSALELANVLVNGAAAIRMAAEGSWSVPPAFPEPATTWTAAVQAFEREAAAAADAIRSASDDELAARTVAFLSGPRQPADFPTMHFLWFILMDAVHHRGQFSVYLRMSGAQVPSIYGPTADEPWT
jgi:uncharacterized damage-inducible protein DinB